jgi:hypothetical protein
MADVAPQVFRAVPETSALVAAMRRRAQLMFVGSRVPCAATFGSGVARR